MCLKSSAERSQQVDEGYYKVTSSKWFTGLGRSCPSLVDCFLFSPVRIWQYEVWQSPCYSFRSYYLDYYAPPSTTVPCYYI